MVKGFLKMYNFSFFGKKFFLQTFLLFNWICKLFCRAQELANDVLFVIFGHQTWDLEGGGVKLTPPSISCFSSTPAEIGIRRPGGERYPEQGGE